MSQPQSIEFPNLPLRACSVADHCRALQRGKTLAFWWYLERSRLLGNFSIPFQGRRGDWWYQVKPGFCWAVECFRPIEPGRALPGLLRAPLGYQHVVDSESKSNSHLVINMISDLATYGDASVDSKRRNAVRKGFKSCTLSVLESFDNDAFEGCRAAWKDLTERTGWKHAATRESFEESWRGLLDCPGVSIIVGRDNESGQVAGFLITKIIGDTAYVDTIASRTEFLKCNVNDAVMFAFLQNAKSLPGITKAHYAIRSYVETLEKFKTGLGFRPTSLPCATVLCGPVKFVLERYYPDKYKRMIGQFDEPEPGAAASPSPAESAAAAPAAQGSRSPKSGAPDRAAAERPSGDHATPEAGQMPAAPQRESANTA